MIQIDSRAYKEQLKKLCKVNMINIDQNSDIIRQLSQFMNSFQNYTYSFQKYNILFP